MKDLCITLLTLLAVSAATDLRASCNQCPYRTSYQITDHPQCASAFSGSPVQFRDGRGCFKFFECNRGTAYEFVCAEGLAYNLMTRICEDAARVDCSYDGRGSPQDQKSPSVSSGVVSQANGQQERGDSGRQGGTRGTCNICMQAKESIPRHQNCPRSNGYYPVYFRHSKDCSQFYQCDQGTAYLIQCPAGLHFNTRIDVCDYPQNVDCSGPVLAPPSLTSPGSSQDGPSSSSCPICQNARNVIPKHPRCPRANGYYPTYFRHQTDCSTFYQCDNGSAYEIVCPAGLHFNTNLNVCDYPEKAGCSGRLLQPSEVTTGTPGPASDHAVDPQCPIITGHQTANYWAHPRDCTKYYGCLWGCVESFSCPDGYRWHETKKACVVARLVKC